MVPEVLFFRYPVPVVAGEIITGSVGAGGAGGTANNLGIGGQQSTVVIGTITLTANGGFNTIFLSDGSSGGISTTPLGSSPTGGSGGIGGNNGGDGASGIYTYSGAGGGSFQANGGNLLLFTGGLGNIAADGGGGGGASAFANGGTPTGLFNGSLGSGGAGGNGTGTTTGGTGGDGFVRIDYYSA